MNALGHYILRGKMQAVAITSLLSIVSLLLPPFLYIISGVPVGLVTLRKGGEWGLHVLLGSLLLVSVFGFFINMGAVFGLVFTIGVWLPVWWCAVVLRLTESQGTFVLVAAGLGVAMVLSISLFIDDLTVHWQSWVSSFLESNFPPAEVARMQELFDATLPFFSGIIASGILISLIVTVLLARWWQARLFNPGGFRDEFYQLLLPRWLVLATFLCLLISVFDLGIQLSLIRNILLVLIVIMMFQGIASAHRTVSVRQMSRGWIVAMYGFLIILPQMALFLACIGMVDAWVRGRGKTPPSDTGQL